MGARRTRAGATIAAAVVLGLAVASSAFAVTPAGNLQANEPQVAGDSSSNTTARFPTNKQNEPTIAQNPVDGRYLIAGANDEQRQPACGPGPVRGPDVPVSDCGFFPGVGTSGVYTSADAGASWTNRGLLDDQASWQGAGVISDGDPVIAYGPKPDGNGGFSFASGARAYYASLATVLGAKGYEYVIVSHSDDNGLTWSAPVIGTTRTSNVDFNDKNWINVDASPTSPFFGRVYLSWTEFRSATLRGYGNEPVMIAASTDGGESFGVPRQLSPAGNNLTGNGRQGSSIAVGPDGTVYVALEQGANQMVAISTNGGAVWSRLNVIGAVADIADPIPGSNFRTDSFPTIAADPRNGSATVYASWATRIDGVGRIVVATSTDAGRSWGPAVPVSGGEGYAFFQGMDVAPNGRVDVAYQAQVTSNPATFGTGNASIDAYAVSKSPGGPWSSPVRISTASSDPAVSAQNNLQRQFWGDYNMLVSDDTGAWFISTDSRRGSGCPAVDAYQRYLVGIGFAIRSDGADRFSQNLTGVNPALADPSVKPGPPVDCPAAFGDTDAVVARFTP